MPSGPGAYNVYRLTLTVYDKESASDHASSTWIYEVVPPEDMEIYSEYGTYFYEGIDVTNTFTIYAEVNNASASSLSATLGGRPSPSTRPPRGGGTPRSK